MSWLQEALPHSASVHVPVALGVLMPPLFLSVWIAVRRGWLPHRIWIGLGALAAVQCAAIGFALLTGERAEFLSAANGDLVERHEHAAQALGPLWLVLTLGIAWVAWRRTMDRVLLALLLGLAVGQAVLTAYAGHLGGHLMN